MNHEQTEAETLGEVIQELHRRAGDRNQCFDESLRTLARSLLQNLREHENVRENTEQD